MKRTSSLQILEKLISFDTTSWKSNLELIDYVRNYLEGHGVKSRILFNEEKSKANIFATIGPCGEGSERSGIILSGHSDVVPVTEQNWTSDPFALIQRGSKVYGRGSCDMKGFIACVLAAVPDFMAAPLKEPIHLGFSYDEETGCTGVKSMVEMVRDMPVKPRACIVGEPTLMKVVNSHKGICHILTRVYGLESHSSTDKGINAVMLAADMIGYISELAEEMRHRTPEVEGFEPPYTTVHVGRIKGGTAANITPSYCEFEWDYRPVPGADEDEILKRFNAYVEDKIIPQMRARSAEYGRVETELMARVPLLLPQTGSDAETLVLALAKQNTMGVVSYGTEAGHFQGTAGVPTVVCGPGSILQAHRPDEYIELSEIAACEEFLQRLVEVVRV